MKRLLHLLAILFLLSGCGSFSYPQDSSKISFMIFGDVAELNAYQQLVAAYTSQAPGAQVDLIHIPGQSDYRKRLAADFTSGSPADVVLINYRRIGQFAAKGALEPLGPSLEKSKVISIQDFYPQAIDAFKWQGQLLCIPQNISSLVVYYNKALFDQAGVAYPLADWAWEDFLAAAQSLTLDLDGDGIADQHGLGFEPTLARFAPFIWQNGGEVASGILPPMRLVLDMPQSLDAVRWVVELQTVHHVVPNAEQAASEDSESRFLNGRLAMYLNSRRGVPAYREIEDFDWDIALLPSHTQTASLLHADAYCMAAQVKNKDAAWRFIEFANSEQGQAIVARSGRTVPSLVKVAESQAFLDEREKPRSSRLFLDVIPHLRALPSAAGWVDAEELADKELERAFYGQASIEEAVTLAGQLAQPYLQQENPTP